MEADNPAPDRWKGGEPVGYILRPAAMEWLCLEGPGQPLMPDDSRFHMFSSGMLKRHCNSDVQNQLVGPATESRITRRFHRFDIV